jgi:hypothetical protein
MQFAGIEFLLLLPENYQRTQAAIVWSRKVMAQKGLPELLLRDKASPLMQELFYKMEQPMPNLTAGQVVRVVGQPLARTRLQAFSVRKAHMTELQRRDLFLSNQSLIATRKGKQMGHECSPQSITLSDPRHQPECLDRTVAHLDTSSSGTSVPFVLFAFGRMRFSQIQFSPWSYLTDKCFKLH